MPAVLGRNENDIPHSDAWVDANGNNCDYYIKNKLCTKNGNMWENSIGSFLDHITDGYTGKNCPHCGCLEEPGGF